MWKIPKNKVGAGPDITWGLDLPTRRFRWKSSKD